MDTNLRSLYNQFLDVVEKGTEEEAKKFLVDHFRDFPEHLQKEIVFAFFEEGLQKASDGERVVAAQRLVAEGIQAMGRVRTKIEDQIKIAAVQEQLNS